jgi:hypothetical protein
MKANGLMIRLMDMECIAIRMVLFTKENGLRISSMEMDLRNGQMDLCLKELTIME